MLPVPTVLLWECGCWLRRCSLDFGVNFTLKSCRVVCGQLSLSLVAQEVFKSLMKHLRTWHPARAFEGQERGSCRPMAFSSGRNLGAGIFSSHVTWLFGFYFLMSGEFCLRSRRFAKLNFSPIKFDPLEKKEKRATNPRFQNYGLS